MSESYIEIQPTRNGNAPLELDKLNAEPIPGPLAILCASPLTVCRVHPPGVARPSLMPLRSKYHVQRASPVACPAPVAQCPLHLALRRAAISGSATPALYSYLATLTPRTYPARTNQWIAQFIAGI